MKPIISLLFLFLSAYLVQAQNHITFSRNSFNAGDSSHLIMVPYVDPGPAGSDKIWDFSTLKYTAGKTTTRIDDFSDAPLAGLDPCDLVLSENGYNYFLSQNSEVIREIGYLNPGKMMSLVYSDPVDRLRFPLQFNDRYSDAFSGTAYYREKSRIDLSGDYILEADGTGTLILPDRIIPQVLRVKTVRKSLQVGVCGSTISTVTKYQWYAPGLRYPVLALSLSETVHAANPPVISGTGYVNLSGAGQHESVSSQETYNPGTESIPVSVFPNPFYDRTFYTYFLRSPKQVSIEITDLAGTLQKILVNKEMKSQGVHTGEIDALTSALTPGIYFIRFVFDGQPVVVKVIKV